MPVNVLAWSGLPELARLRELGVRRLSAGSAISEAMFGLVGTMMGEFLATGRVETGGVKAMAYSELNAAMKRA
jgi:2-methylisocitrate lyase-like PEP mutase family enzyme